MNVKDKLVRSIEYGVSVCPPQGVEFFKLWKKTLIINKISSNEYSIRMCGSEFIYRDDIKQIVLKEFGCLLTIEAMDYIVLPFMQRFKMYIELED